MFLQSYDFTIIHSLRKNILVNTQLRIHEKRTIDTEEKIMKVPTINKLFSTFTFLLTLLSTGQYSFLSFPDFTTSNTTFFSSVLISDSDYCHYKDQADTIVTISGIPEDQCPSSICNNKRYDCEHQDSRHFPIFGKEVYKIISALENTNL
jgi:hypothetical protein